MSEWIDIKDRLPTQTGFYLVTFLWLGERGVGNYRVMHFLSDAYGVPVNRWYDEDISPLITHWSHIEPPNN